MLELIKKIPSSCNCISSFQIPHVNVVFDGRFERKANCVGFNLLEKRLCLKMRKNHFIIVSSSLIYIFVPLMYVIVHFRVWKKLEIVLNELRDKL